MILQICELGPTESHEWSGWVQSDDGRRLGRIDGNRKMMVATDNAGRNMGISMRVGDEAWTAVALRAVQFFGPATSVEIRPL